MSHRFGTALIPGAHVFGVSGLGVIAENIPSEGQNGSAIPYEWLEPSDAGKEIRILVTSAPSGSLFVHEDGAFEYEGENSSFTVQLYVEGVPIGTPQTITVEIGDEITNIALLIESIIVQSGIQSFALLASAAQLVFESLNVSTGLSTFGIQSKTVLTAANVVSESAIDTLTVLQNAGLNISTLNVQTVLQSFGLDPNAIDDFFIRVGASGIPLEAIPSVLILAENSMITPDGQTVFGPANGYLKIGGQSFDIRNISTKQLTADEVADILFNK